MVRFKNRYLLFEIIQDNKEKLNDKESEITDQDITTVNYNFID